jgi:hypothetical protein
MMNLECRMTKVMTNDEIATSFRAKSRLQRSGQSPRGQAFNLVVLRSRQRTGILRLRCASFRMTDSSSFGFRDSFVIRHSCFVIFSLIALAR